ncbi:hypothetical protein GCM10008020_29330 [Massilia psychrophila]|nr:hypothetical protein GCM10008020_29330 [Massilia psychrophila]
MEQFAGSRDCDGIPGGHAKAARSIERKPRPDAPAACIEMMERGSRGAVRQAE